VRPRLAVYRSRTAGNEITGWVLRGGCDGKWLGGEWFEVSAKLAGRRPDHERQDDMTTARSPAGGFRHEAFLYSSDGEFLDGVTQFIREGVARDDALLVIVDAPKIDRLRNKLDGSAASVDFADMREVGRNPALIIQAWQDFVSEHARTGRALRGVGEPISRARSEAELTECHIHEALLNAAFEAEPDLWLLCPYDTARLDDSDVAFGVSNHPHVRDDLGWAVAHRAERVPAVNPLTSELPTPPAGVEAMPFGAHTIHELRSNIGVRAGAAGIDDQGVAGLVLAVSEIATNTVVHGHGHGSAAVWIADGSFICELRGPGRITDPMVGRVRPARGDTHGYGLWLANHFCDLVQIRSGHAGTTVRLHLACDEGRSSVA
jgi:anti-sigma regulatory factor (Ser/Thr protein kinase)